MSYILEALKKSQQERNRGQVPDLQSLHQSVAVADREFPRWPYWALGACLLTLAFLLGWLRPWASEDGARSVVASPTRPSVVADLDKPHVKVETARLQTTEHNRPAGLNPAVVAETLQPGPRRESTPAVIPESLIDISQLPSQIQQSIPQLQFAGHVYSSNPQHRSVIINGRYMSEGDELLPGMRLVQITGDSVVFDWQNQKFKVTVLHDWSFQ